MQTTGYTQEILNELQEVLAGIDETSAENLVNALLASNKVLVAGSGRSGFMAKSFVMRLMHIGLDPYIVGETVTPNLEAGDLFIIASGSGETPSLVAMAEKAVSIGATIAAVTIHPDSKIGKLADIVVEVPAQAKADGNSGKSIQPMGSLFEQSLLVFFDSLILKLMETKEIGSQTMYGRHANLE